MPARAGILEAALNLSGVLFDMEIYENEPRWSDLLDFFARGLGAPWSESGDATIAAPHALNP